jgi:signal transduction histidine kinase
MSCQIVQRHGGSLSLDASHGGAARFVVTLPAPRGERAPARETAS